MIRLLRATTHAKGCSRHFCPAKKIMAQKYSWEMGKFGQSAKHQIKVISERHDLGTCIFGHWKGLAGLKL